MADFDKNLGKYLLKSQLGHGGMGVVYLATDTRLKRDVALKILPRQLASDKAAVERFFQEARVVARLNHPNVVIVHDVDQERGYCYLVMELLTGGTMQQMLERGPLPWNEATRVIAQACRGLAAAQEAGLIHRDIKPSNIMKAANGTVKLTDFGLAKIVDNGGDTTPISNGGSPLTKTGTVMGTPEYMSPEQCRGEALDGRCDLYALGATYFALLVGQPPFGAARLLQAMFAHCSRPTPNPCDLRADLPAACGAIVLKAMAKNRADRYASAREMAAALDKTLGSMPATLPSHLASSQAIQSAAPPAPRTIPFVFESLPDAVPIATVAAPRAARSRRGLVLGVVGGAFLLLAAVALVVWKPFGTTEAADVPVAAHEIDLQPRADIPVGNAPIRGAVFSADGASVYSGALDGKVQQWDVGRGRVVRTFAGVQQDILTLAANSRWLAAGGSGKRVWLWKLDADGPPVELADFAGSISALAFSPDGKRLAVGTYAEVKLYEMNDKGATLIKVLGTSAAEPMCYMVMGTAFSSDSRLLAATTWTSKRVFVWKASNGALHATSPPLAENPMAAAFVPGKDLLLIGLQHRGLVEWEPGHAAVGPVRGEASARALAVAHNGGWAAFVGEWGGAIRVLDLQSDAPARILPHATNAAAVTIALSPDGKQLAAGGGDESPPRGYLHVLDVVQRKFE